MNIMHVMGMRSLKFGGLERFMLLLGKELYSQNDKLIILYEEMPLSVFYVSELKKYGTDIIALPARGLALFPFSITFLRLLFKYKPGVIHCHFDPAGYLALFISWLFRVKRRHRTLHSLITINNIEVKNVREISLKTWFLMKLMYRLSTNIFSVSYTIRNQFGLIFGDNSKIETIYLGVDDIIYNKHISREKYDMPDKLIIVCVAFHGYIKGIDILLEALSTLKNDYGHDNVLLYQIGGGAENMTKELKGGSII